MSLVAATATQHISPVPTISTLVAIIAVALLAVHLAPRWALVTAFTSTLAAAIAAATVFSATREQALWAGGVAAVTTALIVEIVRRLRSRSHAGTGEQALDVRSPAEPILLQLARQSFSEFERGDIETSLESLIEALDCDSITVWRNTENGLLDAEVVCWAGNSPDPTARIVWSRVPSVAGLLSTAKNHVFQDVNDLPSPDRAGYRRHGVTAAVEVPIMVHQRWIGHVSMACQLGARTWEDYEIDAVTAVSEMVSSVWTRQANLAQMEHVVAQRDRSLSIQRALSEAARLIFESDEDQLDRILEVILSSLEGRVAYFMTVRHHDEHGVGLVPAVSRVAQGAIVPAHLESGQAMSIPSHYLPLLDGEPLMISDRDRLDHDARTWYSEMLPQTLSELIFPVMNGEAVVGVLGLTSNTTRAWDAAEIRTLSAIAQMLGVARTRAEVRRGLEDIVKAKDSFIASVSHQLRTPIAVVMGLSSELSTRWSDFSQGEIMEFVDLMARESREVSHIIEDLLIAARASADSITMLPEMIRLDETVAEAIGSMSAEATHRVVSVDLSPVSTMADPLRVRQIVRNLVTNGHRHGGRQIFIRVTEEGGKALFDVSDDGAGIPQERRDQIFDAYESGETDGWTAKMGLGLTVSRQLARLMGGEVSYVHDPLPTFRLSLPVGALLAHPVDIQALPGEEARLTA